LSKCNPSLTCPSLINIYCFYNDGFTKSKDLLVCIFFLKMCNFFHYFFSINIYSRASLIRTLWSPAKSSG
jgi:hypothetical protein